MQQNDLTPDFGFMDTVEAAGPFHTTECFQCRKCTNGCPASFAMDLYPDQIIRLAILGRKEEILRCQTIWVCSSCETCSSRCPNGVRIAELMDYFKEEAVREGVASPEPRVLALHQAFLRTLRMTGRVFEGALLPMYLLKSGQMKSTLEQGTLKDEMMLGWNLFRKGRLSLYPRVIRGRGEVSDMLRSNR
jgi:heterodisulfide reductase subunit C2